MKKITNKIVIITIAVLLMINIILLSIWIYKNNKEILQDHSSYGYIEKEKV